MTYFLAFDPIDAFLIYAPEPFKGRGKSIMHSIEYLRQEIKETSNRSRHGFELTKCPPLDEVGPLYFA